MAKLIFTAAALFLLFAFSHARTPSDLPNGRDDAADKIPVTDAEPFKATTNTLRLPSERPGSESGPVVELEETETVPVAEEEKKLPEAEFASIESNEENTADASKSEAVPLTIISFRPVGRHFPRRPFPLSLRPGHRCGHGRRQPKRWTPRFHGSEREKDTPYGDDMILSSGDEMKFDRPFRGGARQIPARWFNFRHGGPRFPYKHDDDMESERPHRHHRRHHHHDHDLDQENEGEENHREHKHDHEHRHEHEHEHRGGLFRGFRKFLNRF